MRLAITGNEHQGHSWDVEEHLWSKVEDRLDVTQHTVHLRLIT